MENVPAVDVRKDTWGAMGVREIHCMGQAEQRKQGSQTEEDFSGRAGRQAEEDCHRAIQQKEGEVGI